MEYNHPSSIAVRVFLLCAQHVCSQQKAPSHLPFNLLRLALGLPSHLLRLSLGLARQLGRLALGLTGHFLRGALGLLGVEADGRFDGFGCLLCGVGAWLAFVLSAWKKRKEKGKGQGWKLTALLDTLHSRIANGLVHGIDGIFDRGAGILLRKGARGKADALGGSGGSQWGARSSGRNDPEERHVL